MNDTTKYIGYAMLAVILAIFSRVAWVAFYPYVPIVIHSIEVTDPDNTVTSGEDLEYITRYDKKILVEATVARYLVNSVVIPVPSYRRQVPMGKGVSLNSITVPSYADPGVYHLHIAYSYLVSNFPERRITIEADSGPFTVVNKTKVIQDALIDAAADNKANIQSNEKLLNALDRSMKGKKDR